MFCLAKGKQLSRLADGSILNLNLKLVGLPQTLNSFGDIFSAQVLALLNLLALSF